MLQREEKEPRVLTTGVVVVCVVLAAAVLASLWLRHGRGRDPSDQVSAFEAARAVTSRWSADPDTTPAPLRDYLHGQRREQSPDDARPPP